MGKTKMIKIITAGLLQSFSLVSPAASSPAAPSPAASSPVASGQICYDTVIKNALIYDGTGNKPYKGTLYIKANKIAHILKDSAPKTDILCAQNTLDAKGMAAAPGFINIISWAGVSLMQDGRSLGGLLQGVTLEVFGEGKSMGPINENTRQSLKDNNKEPEFIIKWKTFGGYLDHMVQRGISTNIASFVGAATIRIHELNYENRAPHPAELSRMKLQVAKAMEEGALGLGTSLIYAPAFYAKTDELIALAKTVSHYGGIYTSHIRSEGAALESAVDELITIAQEADLPAEIYHLKFAGKSNWSKFDLIIDKIEAAQKNGVKITADMYLYTAASTGLGATMPPWVFEGGLSQLLIRLQDPMARIKIAAEMLTPSDQWENYYTNVGPDKIMVIAVEPPELKKFIGKTVSEIAKIWGKSPTDTIMDLILINKGDLGGVYFMMSEENVKKQIALPWVTFGSDARSMSASGSFLENSTHPRAYGNVSRLLGKYVREEKIISLTEAISRLSGKTALKLNLKNRGFLKKNYAADIVIFDPKTIADKATFAKPHQLSIGVHHVFVNGIQVIKDTKHTGKFPGEFVKGPGYKPK
jgi:N-acyl-D-amino-acid deacylase